MELPWMLGVPCTAFFRRQLPFGATRLWAIWRRECVCVRISRYPYLGREPCPMVPLRRVCRRQSPAPHTSTHGIFLVAAYRMRSIAGMGNESPWTAENTGTVCQPEYNHGAAIRVRSRRSPPRLCEAEAPASRMRAAEEPRRRHPCSVMTTRATCTFAFPPPDHPEARSAEGKLAVRECGARRTWGSRTSAVRRAQSASLTDEDSRAEAKPPWSAGMQGAIAQWPLARRRHNEIEGNQQGRTVFVETAPSSARHLFCLPPEA